MNNKQRYRDLMEGIRQSHQEFAEVWREVRATELQKRNIVEDERDPTDSEDELNPDDIELDEIIDFHYPTEDEWEQIHEANGIAYKAASPQSNKRNELLDNLFTELPFEEFLEGKPEAIDAILDFLEIDVLAFRCGYAKEWCLHRLKSLPVNEEQVTRLRGLALNMCQFKGQRRELKQLARLMIRLADEMLTESLYRLATSHDNPYTRQKAERVLCVVLNGRHDLW